ncbi:hypothetical protein ABIF41_008244 [Bradyrhizobium japonicum]
MSGSVAADKSVSAGNPDVPLHHLEDGVAQRLDAETLRDETGSAEIERAADRGAVVGGRDDHHRDRRILRAQIDQAGKAGDPGHRQIEQDQVDVGGLLQQLGQILERSGLVDPGRGQDARHRLPQRIAEQGMIIGNDEMGRGSVHRSLAVIRYRLASRCRGWPILP